MRRTYAVKSHFSQDQSEEITQNTGMTYLEAVQMLTVFREDWRRMGLQVKACRNRVEARGATYQMAVWVEKDTE